jgi:hypothetical protein
MCQFTDAVSRHRLAVRDWRDCYAGEIRIGETLRGPWASGAGHSETNLRSPPSLQEPTLPDLVFVDTAMVAVLGSGLTAP